MNKIAVLFSDLLLCKCATFEKSVGLGATAGALSGITAAQIAHYNTKGNVVLGLTGALVGAVIGALLHRNQTVAEATIPPATGAALGGSPPLKSAEKDVLWIPDKIVGDKFEERHRIWTIKKPAHWQLYPEEQDRQPREEAEATDE